VTWVTPGTLLRRYGRSSVARRRRFRGVRPEVLSVAHSCAELRSREDCVSRRRGLARVCLSIRHIPGPARSNVVWQRQSVGFRRRVGDPAFLVLYLVPSSPMGNLHCQHLLRLRLGNGRLPDLLTVLRSSDGDSAWPRARSGAPFSPIAPLPQNLAGGSFGANSAEAKPTAPRPLAAIRWCIAAAAVQPWMLRAHALL